MQSKYKFFQGQWGLSRFIQDENGSVLSTMKGEVSFFQHLEGVLYQEKVKNYFSGSVFSASREYLYRMTSKKLDIYLMDNRLLASFDREKLVGEFSSFLCGDDCYQTKFSSLSCDKIVQTVQVTGKSKQFYIETQLVKLKRSRNWRLN